MKLELGSESYLVVSYLTLRKAIGILGIALPFVVSLGAGIIFRKEIQNSLSGYYYTGMRDVFVGTLCAIGVFLLSYKGYERIDDIAADLASIFAIGVALFPTAPDGAVSDQARSIGYIHLGFAVLFFLTLIYFSLFLFTKTNPSKSPTPQKLQRNMVYRACGTIMGVCVALMIIYTLLTINQPSLYREFHPLYWLETIAIVSFGFSWLTKGEAILKDQPAPAMSVIDAAPLIPATSLKPSQGSSMPPAAPKHSSFGPLIVTPAASSAKQPAKRKARKVRSRRKPTRR